MVILGLLTGGILAGQNLIRAAEIRKTIDQFTNYQSAIYTFRDKYFAIPGDMTNATDFFGEINASHATCIATASPDGKQTCNGDGDGYVNRNNVYAASGWERYHGWLHLAAAGLIEGSYTGLDGNPGTFTDVPGENTPKTAFSRHGWHMNGLGFTLSGDANYYDRSYTTPIALMTRGSWYAFLPEELWNIDTKLDDGKPATGSVYTYKSTGTWAPNCADGAGLDAEYNLSYTSKACSFTGHAL